MDFDSSSKFISSLAKFLQSLCNGYVEFNSGVEVIGHIYLNVDTGKKIDYILNEKVCKTDENSVTFISNSFHAQPAEKPKPSPKGSSDYVKQTDTTELKVDEEEIIIMDEPESKNVGTLPSRDLFRRKSISPHTKAGRPPKRPHSQNISSVHKHSKQHKSDPSLSGPNGAQHEAESIHSESNSSSNFVPPQLTSETSLAAASESDISHLSKVFPQTFGDSSNNQNASEERDIKPQLDGEMNIIQVKQEFSHSEHGGDEDQETYDDSQDQSTVFPGMPYDPYYGDGNRRGHRSDYGTGGLSQDFFQGAGPSEGVGDSSVRFQKSLQSNFTPTHLPHQEQTDSRWRPPWPKPYVTPSSEMSKFYPEAKEKRKMSFECEVCGKGLPSRREYVGHMNGRHLGKKPFACELCGRQFAYITSLPMHKKTCPARHLANPGASQTLASTNSLAQTQPLPKSSSKSRRVQKRRSSSSNPPLEAPEIYGDVFTKANAGSLVKEEI